MTDPVPETAAQPQEAPAVETLPDNGYRYVTTPAQLEECVADLQGTKVLAADIEGDSFFSYTEKTCLLQMTGDSGVDWVVDPLAVPDLEPLRALMESPDVVKIFHGADYDVVSLKRDHGFQVAPIWDTMIAAQATGHERFGLSDLVHQYFGDKLEKKYQRHDWSRRPLLKEHLDYARLDSHYLPRLREILMARAAETDREAMLAEEFQLLESREWTGRPFDPDSCLKVKGSNKLDETGKRVLRALFVLRDTIAERKNRPAFKVWGNDANLKIARARPADQEQLIAALGPKSHIARRHGDVVLAAVAKGRKDTSPIPARKTYAPPRTSPEVPPYTRDDEPLFGVLKQWRNRRAVEVKLTPAMIVNNTVLRHIAALKPKGMADLDLIEEMRNWQRNAYGEELLLLVKSWLADNPASTTEETAGRRRGRRRRRRGGGAGRSDDAAQASPDARSGSTGDVGEGPVSS